MTDTELQAIELLSKVDAVLSKLDNELPEWQIVSELALIERFIGVAAKND